MLFYKRFALNNRVLILIVEKIINITRKRKEFENLFKQNNYTLQY